eukprot:1238456-Lingulodinium_polyedra.AAC.1
MAGGVSKRKAGAADSSAKASGGGGRERKLTVAGRAAQKLRDNYGSLTAKQQDCIVAGAPAT